MYNNKDPTEGYQKIRLYSYMADSLTGRQILQAVKSIGSWPFSECWDLTINEGAQRPTYCWTQHEGNGQEPSRILFLMRNAGATGTFVTSLLQCAYLFSWTVLPEPCIKTGRRTMASPHSPWDRNCKLFAQISIVEATNSHTKAALMDHTALRRDNLNVR